MSHFSVLVITDHPDAVSTALQPYHEYECTGVNDEFVVWVDHTDEIAKEWAESTETAYRAPDGTVYNECDDVFYRNPTPDEKAKIGPFSGTGCGHGISWTSKDWNDGLGYRAKVHFIPSGFVKFDRSLRECYATMEAYAEAYHGYTVNEKGRIGRFTNPNAKWDWWQIGGRYPHRLLLRDGSRSNQAQWGDIDIAAMRNEAERKAHDTFDRLNSLLQDHALPPSWDEIRTNHPGELEAAREEWRAYSAVAALNNDRDFKWKTEWWLETYRNGRIAHVERQRRDALTAFAIVKDHWYERGEMGWWACVSNEKDEAAWAEERDKLLSDLADDAWITMVDCHI